MLCLSGFELYTRWVLLNLVFQIYQIPSLRIDPPGERDLIFSEGRGASVHRVKKVALYNCASSHILCVVTISPPFSQMAAFKIRLENF